MLHSQLINLHSPRPLHEFSQKHCPDATLEDKPVKVILDLQRKTEQASRGAAKVAPYSPM